MGKVGLKMSIVNFKESLINNYLLIASFDKKTHKCEWLKRHGEVMDQPKVYNEGSYFFLYSEIMAVMAIIIYGLIDIFIYNKRNL